MANNDIWIFCYGSNSPRQLCDRIGTPYDSILNRLLPVKLQGYRRGFCNQAASWGGKSTATLFATGNDEDEVFGIAFHMTLEEVETLDPYEGYPWKYDRKEITMQAWRSQDNVFDWRPLTGQAYI